MKEVDIKVIRYLVCLIYSVVSNVLQLSKFFASGYSRMDMPFYASKETNELCTLNPTAEVV